MRHEVLMGMSKSELDDYAKVIGLDVTAKKTIALKVDAIETRRERVADIEVLGLTLSIPVKRMHDKRVTDICSKPLTDELATELLGLLLGDEQEAKLIEAATDEDGTVDVEAMGLAIASITQSEELKNF